MDFSTIITADDTKIYEADPFDIKLNETTAIRYVDPEFMMHNKTANCTKGIKEPKSELVTIWCTEENYQDPELQSWTATKCQKSEHGYSTVLTRTGGSSEYVCGSLEVRKRQVGKIEAELGNIKVVCSTSGLMTAQLMRVWVTDVVEPAMNQTMEIHDGETVCGESSDDEVCFPRDQPDHGPVAGLSWASSHPSNLTDEQRQILAMRNRSDQYIARPDLLLLSDSWRGHSSERFDSHLSHKRIQRLKIPEHTTSKLQPLDVGFFRQYK